MPAGPELLDRAGGIGIAEIFRKIETDEGAEADGHIRISGKIEVDLQGEGDQPDPSQAEVQLLRGHGKNAIGRPGQDVGDQHFLAEPEDEALDSRTASFVP